jgi:glycerate kinase
VGYALIAFVGAHIESGVELVLSIVDFERRAHRCDLIVTGEGRLDYQTLMGKAPTGVLAVGKHLGINVIAIGGGVEDSEALVEGGFWRVYATKPEDMSLEEAMKKETAQQNIRRAARCVAQELLSIVSL